MKAPTFTDKHRGRYRSAAESKQPGYLARRMKAYARLERLKAAKEAARSNVQTLPQRKRG